MTAWGDSLPQLWAYFVLCLQKHLPLSRPKSKTFALDVINVGEKDVRSWSLLAWADLLQALPAAPWTLHYKINATRLSVQVHTSVPAQPEVDKNPQKNRGQTPLQALQMHLFCQTSLFWLQRGRMVILHLSLKKKKKKRKCKALDYIMWLERFLQCF